MKNVHLDIETGDPDDVMALCLLATHPKINLCSVSVFPGGLDQVGLVRYVLDLLGLKIPIGANGLLDCKSRVSYFHYKWLGKTPNSKPDGGVVDIITDSLNKFDDITLITGAPLRNIEDVYHVSSKWFTNWVCQGGFAGDNVVPEKFRLQKFSGKITCPTYNFNGAPKSAEILLNSNRFNSIKLVSKNVCHGYFFDINDINSVPKGIHKGLDLLLNGMETYCKKKPQGKALHDVLAALLAINPSAGTWVKGLPFKESGKWGFKKDDNSNIEIVINVDKNKVLQTMVNNLCFGR